MLNLPVTALPQIGSVFQKRLEKLGIKTISDLLYHFPFRYDDYSLVKKTHEIVLNETVTVIGHLTTIENIYTKNRKQITKASLKDNDGIINVVWFNQHFLTRTLKKNMLLALSGRVGEFNHKIALVSPQYEILPSNHVPTLHTGRLVPIYPETARLSSKWLRSKIQYILHQTKLPEFLPPEIIKAEDLLDVNTALHQIHFPDNLENAEKARYRLSFDELFLLQLNNLQRKKKWQKENTVFAFEINKNQTLEFVNSLPFTLTNSQKLALREILSDLAKNIPMNRLLEGDVGSGKTVVACVASYIAYLNGFQTIFMAPTEILAQQHYDTLQKFLSPFHLNIKLITGSNSKNHPKQEDATHIFIGTHALLHHLDLFTKVGLVIIDEQHRFGVKQRTLLSSLPKGKNFPNYTPHVLTMTATPIPRSLALSLYGDLDLSLIDEMPLGRKKIKTFVVPENKKTEAYDWIQNKIIESKSEEQAFIIYPIIEESETLKDIKAATIEYQNLQPLFPRLKLGLLHGRLKSQEKEKIIQDFQKKKINILLATSVIEVGIDIPSATIIIIENAERFGLAQLHQLRGRVGRSDTQSFCFLFTPSASELVKKRLKSLETENCGSKLAEIDLTLRGPGEIFGTKQHGLPDLKIATLTDFELLKKTKAYSEKILEKDQNLTQYPFLCDKLKELELKEIIPN